MKDSTSATGIPIRLADFTTGIGYTARDALDRASEMGLRDVIILGRDDDGVDTFLFGAPVGSLTYADINYRLDILKFAMMDGSLVGEAAYEKED